MPNISSKIQKYLLPITILVVLVMGLAVGFRLSQQPQTTTPQAQVDEATLVFSGPASVNVGDPLPVVINISAPETISATTPDGIVGIRAVVNFDNTKLSLSQADVAQNLPGWVYPIIQVSPNGSSTTVDINAIYLQPGDDGYIGAAVSPQAFATLNFTTVSSGNTTLNFDPSSEIGSKNGGTNVLNPNSLQGHTIGINSTNVPTNTPGTQPTNTPVPSLTPGPTTVISNTPVPTQPIGGANPTGVPNACGGTCGSNSNCQASFICFEGFCRNPSCVTATNCTCSTATGPTVTSAPQPTSIPTVRPTTRTVSPTVRTSPTATTSITVPTLPPNPFLQSSPATGQLPQVEYVEEQTPVPQGFWARFIAWITNLLRAIFGR